MLTPPNGLTKILLLQFLEPDTVEVKDDLESEPYRILKSELWPYPNTSLDEDPNWPYTVRMDVMPQIAGTDPQAAFDYTSLRANLDDSYDRRCIQGEKVIYLPDTQARGLGHVFSTDGLAELRMSGCCEFHFDKWFLTIEDNPEKATYIDFLNSLGEK